MLYEYLRLFEYDGSSFNDISLVNQDDDQTFNLSLSSTDYLYIAQYYPFNNLFFHMNAVNTVAADLTIEVWDTRQWVPVVDVLDATASAGVPFSKSATLQFEPDRDNNWQEVSDTSKNNAPDELQALKIYDCHWFRMKSNVPLTLDLKEISYSFTSTSQLNDIDIEISKYYESFESGKTDWINEILTASKMVVSHLKSSGLVVHPGQILRFDDISRPTDYKTLELIYMNLGSSYNDRKEEVRMLFNESIRSKRFTFDQDKDGKVDKNEVYNKVRTIQR